MIEPNEHLKDIVRMSERMPERLTRVHLDMNERVTPFEPELFKTFLEQIKPELFCHYPDPSPLYERLSRLLNFPESHIYVTPGSDAAIRMLFQTYLRAGDRVVFPEPTFAMYSVYSQIFKAQAQTIPYDSHRQLDVDQILRFLKDSPRILVIANPDQPTGATLPQNTLRQLAIAAHQHNTLFMIDEAYFPFYPQSAIDFVREFDNVVVLRTFSKVGGLAGLRVGYLVAQPQLITQVSKVRGSFEVNTVGLMAACYLLDHPEIGKKHLSDIEKGRALLKEHAQSFGLEVPPCPANFQLLRFPGLSSTAEIASRLAEKNYLVKGGFKAPSVHDCIRVTLAGPELMTRFCGVLSSVIDEVQWSCPS